MANRDGREALRGVGVGTLDLIFEAVTLEQWAELLKAPLERAACQGNRGLAQKLVEAGAEIGDALTWAVHGGHGEIVNDLLRSGASITAKDTDGHTPLHIAVGREEAEMVQLLLLKGADKDALDNEGCTPLAAYFGNLAAALALLAAGADVSLRCDLFKWQVIHEATDQGYVEILKAAIEHGADLDAVDDTDQNTALHLAARRNGTDAIDVLLEAGANIEARHLGGFVPLHCAADMLSREALLTLLQHGATVNAQNNFFQTPLMLSAAKAGTNGAAEVVDALLRAGADETLVDKNGNKAASLIELTACTKKRRPSG